MTPPGAQLGLKFHVEDICLVVFLVRRCALLHLRCFRAGLLAGVRDSYHAVGGFRYAYPRGTAYSRSVCLSRSGRPLSRDASESHNWNQDAAKNWAADFIFRGGNAGRAASARVLHLVVISNACWHPPILA